MIHIMSNNSKSTLTNVNKEDVQPNAVDLRIGKVFKISSNMFIIDEDQKVHRGSEEIFPDEDGYFNLDIGSYEVIMQNKITVAEGEDGYVITRSTLNRNGVFITSGLYDSGYGKDNPAVMAGVIHVNCGPMKVKVGTRIGQYLSFKAETLHLYDGDYGKVGGHDDKYN